MKYVISDQGEVNVGSDTFHMILAKNFKGRVISAGYCSIDENGIVDRVWGESLGYDIDSKPEDLKTLQALLDRDLESLRK